MARMQDPIQPCHPYRNCNCDELPLIDDTIDRLDQLHLSAGYLSKMHCRCAYRYTPTPHSYRYPYQPHPKIKHSMNTNMTNINQVYPDSTCNFDHSRRAVSDVAAAANSGKNYREEVAVYNNDESVKCINSDIDQGNPNLDHHVANLSLIDQNDTTKMSQMNTNKNKPVMLNMAKAWLEHNQGKEVNENIITDCGNGDVTENSPNYQDDTTPDELASYLEHYLYLPKPMSTAAEMSYS
ncbi:uncharacterized protein TRIADDRAFT_58117 [Trichoplax adhaerens]|uniref:Oxidative stress-responsive serine-rich protein 1 n=1 Tax=Trichoplax adhaerens TaxID=10228 RepID=B3S2R2_TRIAD|nr:hypothetical protein TRIADDRAFT_58117 [Trichoplax adhaerens]EDV23466.1 hypothetical protein TRIADDRAFT_58117 [Trichoplax adhaerens]|eukprot:XP_002114376.1 hypothetical protein TRIADDRAFT_58117 [Trichoplax adhaerens]